MNLLKKQIALLLLLLTLLTPNAFALDSDNQQLIHITSDHFHYDGTKDQGTYAGNVVANQGSRHLTSDQTIIHFIPKTSTVSLIDALGTPAHYQYQPKPQDNLVYASAHDIQYNPATNILSLIHQASITQNGNLLQGSLITYNTNTQIAESNGTQAADGKPILIIQPSNISGS